MSGSLGPDLVSNVSVERYSIVVPLDPIRSDLLVSPGALFPTRTKDLQSQIKAWDLLCVFNLLIWQTSKERA